jgi:hypothetical protein
VEKSIFVVEGALGGWGFEEHSWALRRETIEMFYTYSFMSNFQGEKITKKGRSNGNLALDKKSIVI